MKKINLLGYLSMALLLFFTSCNQQDGDVILQSKEFNTTNLSKSQIQEMSCGETTVVSLIAGQHIDVGTVSVSNDETYLYVTYETTGDWYLTETHLYVGAESDIPLSGGGNPKMGHFPYSDPHGITQSYTYQVDLSTLDDTFVVIAHAVVDKIVNGETIISEETGYGCIDENTEWFPGKRWGCYFEYTKQECEEEECKDVYGYLRYDDHNTCFLDNGLSNFGWSSRISDFDKRLEHNNLRIQLFADVESCDIVNAMEVGYIVITVYSESTDDGEQQYVDVKYYITDSNYVLDEVNLYLGTDILPQDSNGNSTSLPSDYEYHQELDGVNYYKFAKIPRPGELGETVYITPHAKICRIND